VTSARDTLRLTAPSYGFKPEEWHYRLADLTSAMTVLGLFRAARFEPGLLSETLVIEDEIMRERVKKLYLREVAMARGTVVVLHDPPVVRDVDWAYRHVELPPPVPETVTTEKQARAFHVKHLAAAKVDRRTTAEARQRMSAAQKARHKRQRARREREKAE
jgi:hypothetical protein